MNSKKKIFIAGHNGMIGSAILKKFKKKKDFKILFEDKKNLDLTNQSDVFNYLKKNKPYGVILAAAKVGGIVANNTDGASFIYDNLTIQSNVIHGSFLSDLHSFAPASIASSKISSSEISFLSILITPNWVKLCDAEP